MTNVEGDVNEIKNEMGDRVYGSTMQILLSVGGLIVLLVVRAIFGPL